MGSSGLCETVGGVAQAVGSGRWRAGAASLWILDASDAPKPRTCQTVGSGLCETVGGVAQAVGSGLWRAKSFFSSGPKLPFKRLKPLKPLKPLKRSDTCQWLCHTSGFWTLQTLHGCFRRSKTSHLLDCGLWALRESDAPKPRACQTVGSGLCETVGGVAQAVGSGLWRAKSFFSSGPKLPFKRLKPLKPQTPQTLRHLPMVVPHVWILDASDAPWMLQTLQNLALALWSLGSARIRRSKTSRLPDCGLWALRDCGRSCAGCGLGALARGAASLWILDASDAPSTSHLPDCGLWALRDCGRSCASCGLGALARQILFF